uniref:Cation-transporting P-type ATPase N-terminal domain-containing protein n=1 Tax=Oryza punctata TaxID=4537 RepID=A0A0E0JVV8_ORYPU
MTTAGRAPAVPHAPPLSRSPPTCTTTSAAPSMWKLVLEQFDDTLMRILLAVAVVSFVLALYDDAEGGEVRATAVVEPLIIFLIVM